jgi:hypothetical protein
MTPRQDHWNTMATVRELQSRARKAFTKWRKEYANVTEKDRRSPVSHLCLTVLMRNNTITNARACEKALREHFIDWNELRVSPIAEVRDALESAQAPNAEQKAFALRRLLRELNGKYTKANFYFDLMDVPEVLPEPEPGEKPEPTDDDEDAEEALSRDTGLPPHPSIPGFVDMQRVLDQPVPLDPKLIHEKNGVHVCGIVWDDAERAPFATLWRVALAERFIEPELEGPAALERLRQVAPEKEHRDLFTFYALLHAQDNWPRIAKDSEKARARVKKTISAKEADVPAK